MVNVVEVSVSMPAVRLFSGFTLTICFGLAARDYTFDWRRGVTRGQGRHNFPGDESLQGAQNDCGGR